MKQMILTVLVVGVLGSLIGNTIYTIGKADTKDISSTILCLQDRAFCEKRIATK